MKEIKLFVDFEFTSLSPDAQLISVGIVSENKAFITPVKDETQNDIISNFCVGSFRQDFSGHSFYAEFTDFDISRCDDWVKENVVSKLTVPNKNKLNGSVIDENNNHTVFGYFKWVAKHLNMWLSKFSDYKIQFVVDCGTWDWYWLLQLLAEWEEDSPKGICIIPEGKFTELQLKELMDNWKNTGISVFKSESYPIYNAIKRGLPKLPDNISPVPMDLNDLIAFKKGISVSEAFDLNREELAFPTKDSEPMCYNPNDKHNAMWDAKVIKAIYEQLNS